MEKEIELSLEVQVDPASKKILSNPHKCNSELLDVTVVRPKELDGCRGPKTSTLRADEVRKLLTAMERQRRENQKLLDNLKYDDAIVQIRKHNFKTSSPKKTPKHRSKIASNSPVDELDKKDFVGIGESVEPLFCEIRRSLKNVETRITNMQDIDLVISHTSLQDTSTDDCLYRRRRKTASCMIVGDHLKNNYAYHSDRAVNNLKSVLRCKNKERSMDAGKVEGRCVCENCGIVGLLTECEKVPLLDYQDASLPTLSPPQSKRKTKFTERQVLNDDYQQISYINQLSRRVKHLEERLAMQEERAVPKEYFRKVISKMMGNFVPKSYKSRSEISVYTAETKQYKKEPARTMSPIKRFLHSESSQDVDCFRGGSKSHSPRPERNFDKSTLTDEDVYYSANLWRWGEEILKPGIDLKNRIVTLLTEILSKFTISEKTFVERPMRSSYPESRREPSRTHHNTEALKKIMEHTNPKVYNAHISTTKEDRLLTLNNDSKNVEEVKPTHIESPKNIEMSYINPNLSEWPKSFHGRFKDKPTLILNRPPESTGKQEFLKIISKAKSSQKQALWNNIWAQAEANGQTKEDKITIKIPTPGKGAETGSGMFETELAIMEVEEVLTKN